VQFTAIGDSTNEIFWSFGDGSFSNNIRNPAHVYADTGFYLVRYSTGNGVCVDTVSKTIFIGYRPGNIILTPDTTICFGSSKLLRSNIDSTLGFCWSPGNFLDDVNLANPTTSTTGHIMYTLLSLSEENNLVVNGDFSIGNTGFSSQLAAGAAPLSSGSYLVTNTSLNAGPQTSDCKDHTNAAGNMMVVSSTNTAASLWNQTVTITPNTNYIFSCWIQSVQPFNSTQLQLSINGNVAADNLITAANACEWTRYFVTWNSGNNTTAILSIFNKANPTGGDFFAIDDISFAGYAVKRDTVMILVDTPLVTTRTDTAVCQSVPVQLTTSGAVSYSWSPVAGLSNPASSSPDATPDTTTQYVVTGTNANGCVATDAVLITVKPKPTIIITGDTLVCRNTTVPLFASGGTSYLWSPAATLSNASISNPVATPGTDTVYRVTVTGANNCSSMDSVKITIQQAPVFTVSPDQRTCSGSFAQLAASGGDIYSWNPAAMVSDATISNPVTLSNTTTTYTVTIKESTCNDSVSLSSTVTVLPLPTITAGKSNDIDCTTGSANLQATGALQYVWAPATGLNDVNSAAPIASPVSTTLYTVRGTDGNGCSADDAVTVLVDLTNKASYAVPNAFTPNGDGKNDCFGVKYFGPVQEFQLVIFNRWGERVFTSFNTADCWDGTYKGNPSDNGNYIYFIKAKTACGPVERKGNVLLVR
jgi:gliding motility-associated-like protein